MDHRRFDDLTRSLTAAASRRGALKGLLAAVGAGAVALGVAGEAVAAPTPQRKKERQCPRGKYRCGKQCRQCCKDAHCPWSGVCGADGKCLPATCNDNRRNGDETDVDCGGSCSPCADGKLCAANGDCASGVCNGGRCKAPTCDDRVLNGDETDVDCGGSCPKCADGANCKGNGDCDGGFCCGDVCVKCGEDQVCDPVTPGRCCTPTVVCKEDTVYDVCGSDVGERCPAPPPEQICLSPGSGGTCCPDETCSCGCGDCCVSTLERPDGCSVSEDGTEEFCCSSRGQVCEDGSCCTSCAGGTCVSQSARLGTRRRAF